MQQNTVNWRKNFKIVWFGSMITDLGNAMTLPFIVLYIDTLGNFTNSELNILGALAFSLTYFAKAIVSPLWGRLADQKGRKLMCLRASGIMTITIFLVGLSPNIWFLLFFRTLQGAFSGYINNANALISVEAPVDKRGKVMSKLITGSITGTLMGPLLGGILASTVGYRGSFFVTSLLMAVVFVTTLFGVNEEFVPIKRDDLKPVIPIMKKIGSGFFISLFVSLLTIQATTNAITPMISLFVKEIAPNSHNLNILTGIVSSAPGFATIIMAGSVGGLIDKFGAQSILMTFLILAIFTLFLTSFIQNVWQFATLRFVLGIADAALLPAIQILTVQNVPQDIFGRIFSYNQSAQAMGSVIGPIIAATIANGLGYRSIFLFTGGLEIIALLCWLRYYRGKKQLQRKD
ncbi:MFS transporter [Companilactobacillus allii]|uniref:MFS transporter n=1 Tax=Companilactobacillus allii TaxID=1847728 RepID=A0A1P8Q2M6_9LACO|nr:MFS transporter [Companilactobacillus allii]APX72123.1 MFS transporter [Companilactobacillus allii]USQ69219.1 MFS transporter [Companilactobacillus allii]